MKYAICFSVLLMLSAAPALAEDYNMTTYFPSPSGKYEVLSATTRIGIGTSSPVASLQVSGPMTNTVARPLYVQGSSGTATTAALVNPTNYGVSIGGIDSATYGAVAASLFSSGAASTAAPLALNAGGGNVGVGTTNPVHKLHVNGNMQAGTATDPISYGVIQITRPANPGDTRFWLSMIRAGTNVAGLGFQGNSTTLGLVNASNNASTAGIFIDTGGKVGIGTSAPVARTHLYNATSGGDFGLGQQSDSTPYMRLGMDTSWVQYLANNAYWTGAAYNYVNTGGYGGLASAIRQVSGTIWFDTASGGTNPITWNNRMTIQNNGYVGIGIATPGFIFDVNGRMRMRAGGGTAGSWYMNAANTLDRAFVGMVDDNTVGFWGNGGVGWGLAMNVNSGDLATRTITTTGNITATGTITSTGSMFAPAFVPTSDLEAKENVKPLTDGVKKVQTMKGVYFNFKGQKDTTLGVIAQDVEKAVPEAVVTSPDGMKGVNYNGLVAVLIEAVKEQEKRIDALEKDMKKLRAETNFLRRKR